MSIERTFHCDGPDCERFIQTRKLRPPLFVTVLENDGAGTEFESHFCGWDCVLRHAASKEPEQILAAPTPFDES